MGKLRLALMDMYKGEENLGLESLEDLIKRFHKDLSYQIFEVRSTNEVPDASFDVYISSGGPGSPKRGDGDWEGAYFKLLDTLWEGNRIISGRKKYFLFICHSFQLACNHFGLGIPRLRKSPSFGIYPVHKTDEGKSEPLFQSLTDPFHVMDSREWQVIEPDYETIDSYGAKIVSIEKNRPQVDLERAVMAMRFSPEWVGVQFHPEANPYEARVHFSKIEIRTKVIKLYGQKKYDKLMEGLDHPEEIYKSWDAIVPGFIQNSIVALKQSEITVDK